MSEYLWDRSGPPDPEIQRLEETLGCLRLRGGRRPARRWWPAAIAAALLLGVALWQSLPRMTEWEVLSTQGPRQVRSGQTLRTGTDAWLTLHADQFGRVDVAPGSEVRVLAQQRLNLRRGTIHALIWAPPGRFVVDTPSSRTVDLGCQYTLSVDPRGDGLVEVETGWVAFQYRDREAFIPAGAACATRRQEGPGVPYFRDASQRLQQALASGDLAGVLAEARPRDGLTLWHLLSRVPTAQRGKLFDRFVQLVPLPAQVTREGVIAGNARMLDLCWNALNLENTEWWRGWKRAWF